MTRPVKVTQRGQAPRAPRPHKQYELSAGAMPRLAPAEPAPLPEPESKVKAADGPDPKEVILRLVEAVKAL